MNMLTNVWSWSKYSKGKFSLHIFPAFMIILLGLIYGVVAPVPKLFSFILTVILFMACGYVKANGNISFKSIMGLLTLIFTVKIGFNTPSSMTTALLVALISNVLIGFKDGDKKVVSSKKMS